MRKIKFRGRSINYVAANDSYWAYGLLVNDDPPEIECDDGDIYRVNDDTVGQYTGLEDADGREIYEGDLVECGSGRICQVVFFKSECACCFDLVPVGGFDCKPPKESTLWKDLTVIGNVHDNPEFLEVEA